MPLVTDVYSATPPSTISQDVVDLIDEWQAAHPAYADPVKAKGKCSRAAGAFLRFAQEKGFLFCGLELCDYDRDLVGGVTGHNTLLGYHVVVDLGDEQIFDPTARQYHAQAPVPAYASYESLSKIWSQAYYHKFRGVNRGGMPRPEGWHIERPLRKLSNSEFFSMLGAGPPGSGY